MKCGVGKKGNRYWIWLAIDVETSKIVGVHIGSRDKQGAQGLWDSLPEVYRQSAISYTDFWEAYVAIFPSDRHCPVGKKTGLTNLIERFRGCFGKNEKSFSENEKDSLKNQLKVRSHRT